MNGTASTTSLTTSQPEDFLKNISAMCAYKNIKVRQLQREKKQHFTKMMICCYTELQIRRGKRDNLRILFWHFCIKHICLDSSLEPPNRDGFNEEFQHVSLQIGWLVVLGLTAL